MEERLMLLEVRLYDAGAVMVEGVYYGPNTCIAKFFQEKYRTSVKPSYIQRVAQNERTKRTLTGR